MKIKKFCVAILALVLGLSAFAGCAGEQDNSGNDENNSEITGDNNGGNTGSENQGGGNGGNTEQEENGGENQGDGSVKVTDVSITPSSARLAVNERINLIVTVLPENATLKDVTWATSDKSIVTVNSTGRITGKAEGTATVTATAKDGSGVSAICEVSVRIPDMLEEYSEDVRNNLSADGYVKDEIPDFSIYEGTSAYRVVTTADEFIAAIEDADESKENRLHVIEIANDLEMGYNKLSESAKKKSIVVDFTAGKSTQMANFTMSDMLLENGMTQLKVERKTDLLIYSKNGAKLTHVGFKVSFDRNVVFRNIKMDEMWQWEDTASSSVGAVGDYDAFGWAYFKVAFSENIWIDHCTFGKSYDGQIDYSNPLYEATGGNGLHISWCRFESGSDDRDGYLYKMMEAIEQNYLANKADSSVACKYLYYKLLRDANYTFEDILYGIAIPQKKCFLCGDNGNDNYKLRVSISNCIFKNVEDRIPKLRGGNAYMYNCIVDCFEYNTYRGKLKADAQSIVQNTQNGGNSSWKCGLVSQGIVCGSGGSVMAESCIFRGINSLLKNNDGSTEGGYLIRNCSNQISPNMSPTVGSSDGKSNPFLSANASAASLKPENFEWHTDDGSAPFEICAIELSKLEEYLNDEKVGAGVGDSLQERLLKSSYMEF